MADMGDVELLVDAHALVGEGPIWQPRDSSLIWVDILSHLVHRYGPATGADTTWDVGQAVGAAATRESGGLVLAVETGFATLDTDTGRVTMLVQVEQDNPGNRMNDGKCDSVGQFWAGTMPYDWKNHRGEGSLYRLGLDHQVTTMFGGLSIANGIGWSPDDRLMYYIDSPTQRIDVFDYDANTGAVENRRLFAEVAREDGVPDGLCVDADGGLWVAVFGGWQVRHYTPDGRMDRVVRVPANNTTSCAFGGPDLSDLYITCGSDGLSEADWPKQPHAGGLFRCRPGMKGLPPQSYKG